MSSESETEPPAQGKDPWVRYRVEYRDNTTGELFSELYAQNQKESLEQEESRDHHHVVMDEPIFELMTVYQARRSAGSTLGESSVSFLTMSHTTHLTIYSPAIINALQSVVKYYPSQDLTGNPLTINYPYAVLAHHYDELDAFREACATKAPDEMCAREEHASEHLALLIKFLDDSVMTDVRLEMERNKEGIMTWEHSWVGYKPGSTRVQRFRGDKDYNASVVHSVTGGIFDSPPTMWQVQTWSLQWDGSEVGTKTQNFHQSKFDGESYEKNDNDVYLSTEDFLEAVENKSLSEQGFKKIEYGKAWWKLLTKQCKHYKGKTRDYPHNEVDGLVMADMASNDTAAYSLDDIGCRTFFTDCTCPVCEQRRVTGERKVLALFEDYNGLSPTETDELEVHQYLLCPFEMPAFVFKTRAWETLHVRGFSEPDFQEDMIHGLVMDERRKETIKALAISFARRNKHGEELAQGMWSADFVRGKGSGLIFLLHGMPGVGKTCTAECISAYTRRPLMVLTPSDIGITPTEVETNLTTMFQRARRWDAVLLIDEADVFMERRTAADLIRNSLVAAFLRALENFDGILFLTTNRVGSFDDAFRSRVHVQLYYPDFTDVQRQQVWKTFTDKLAKDRGDSIRLNIDAKEYIRGAEVRALEWNGRDIRNAFQTAVALAEYGGEKDEEGKILVTDTHLRAVAELSRDFKDYIHTLHKGDEAKRAERKYERLDGFSSTPLR